MLYRLFGYAFVIMCPFLGGFFPFGVWGTLANEYDSAMGYFGVYGFAWVIIYALWFDGSKLQRSL